MVIGRVTAEYAEVRRTLTALLSEVDRHADTLQRLVWYLAPQHYSTGDLRAGGAPPDFTGFPTAEELRKLVDETLGAISRKKHLQYQLKEFGAEPKD